MLTSLNLLTAISTAKTVYTGRDPHFFHKLDKWLQLLGPEMLVKDITADDVDRCIGILMAEQAQGWCPNTGVIDRPHKRANGTINRYITALCSLLKLLRLHRHLPRSFVSPVVKGLKLSEGPGRTIQVSLKDVHRLLDASRMSKNRKLTALIAVAVTTGLRRGNIMQLTWNQVDLKARTIDITRTKNGSPVRSVLPAFVCTELSRIRPHNAEPHWFVFDNKQFVKAWQKTLERAEIPGLTCFHHLRHVAASILASSGASLPEVMAVLNHKNPGMSLRYMHLSTKSIETAVTRAWS